MDFNNNHRFYNLRNFKRRMGIQSSNFSKTSTTVVQRSKTIIDHIFFKNCIPDMSTITESNTDEVITLDTTQESNSVSGSLVLSSENISIECNRNGVLQHKILSNGFDPLIKQDPWVQLLYCTQSLYHFNQSPGDNIQGP